VKLLTSRPARFVSIAALCFFTATLAAAQDADTSAHVGPAGPYYALVIGNDNYQYLPHLQTATNDAKAIARVLHDEYGFSTSVLLDATRADILDALSTYRARLPVNSNLVIYYAGHGTNDTEAKVAYWLPVDAQSRNNANWISAEDITAELRVIKALHVLVIADSCYSGALMRGITDSVDINSDLRADERNYYITKLQQVKSRNLMASGGNEPVADGGADGHSIFAAVVLQSLRDKSANLFTASSLFQRVVIRVAGRSRQTPQYSGIVNSEHDGGDFLFFRDSTRTPPPDICCAAHNATNSPASTAVIRGISPGFQTVEDVLTAYRSAYENEDVAELQKLWPKMPSDSAKSLQSFFKTAKSVTFRYNIVGTPEIGAHDATINFTAELTYIVDGRTKTIPAQKATMKLNKYTQPTGGESWKIDYIR